MSVSELDAARTRLEEARARLTGQPIEAHFSVRMRRLMESYHGALAKRIHELKSRQRSRTLQRASD